MTITPGTRCDKVFNDKRCATAHLDGGPNYCSARREKGSDGIGGAGAGSNDGGHLHRPCTTKLTANHPWGRVLGRRQRTPAGPAAKCKPDLARGDSGKATRKLPGQTSRIPVGQRLRAGRRARGLPSKQVAAAPRRPSRSRDG